MVTCDRGCDAAADGCRLCEPGETTCTNGKVATCDSAGVLVSSTPCPLGCFEDEPRCRDVDPSNGLALYLDMVANPPSLDLENATFDTTTGRLHDLAGGVFVDDIPSFLIAAPPNGVKVRVFVLGSLKVTQLRVQGDSAFAVVAQSDVEIRGRLEVFCGNAFGISGCNAGNGQISSTCEYSSTGAGGGAFGTNGSKGGDITSIAKPGGTGGIANGNAELVPLRGGCPSGVVTDGVPQNYLNGGAGGGAVQLVSRTRIVVDGIVDVKGWNGDWTDYEITQSQISYMGTGGGAGGAILLEAPVIMLDVNAHLNALGGNGAQCLLTDGHCPSAGMGARPGVAATPAANAAACIGDGTPLTTGGGGGGLGRIRINTADGTYTKASSAVEDGIVSSGIIRTR